MPLIVSITSPDLEAVSKMLQGVVVNHAPERAIQEAISRSLLAGRTAASKGVRDRYNISAGEVKANVDLKQASFTNLTGSISYKGPMLPIEAFKPSVRTRRAYRRGPIYQYVHATIIKGNRKLITGAFMKGDRVMERKQPERYPIFRVMTIGLPYMVRQTGIVDTIQERMQEVYNTRLESNIQAMLSGFWRGRKI
jgi:Prophage minor tail protein Z (GPZ)